MRWRNSDDGYGAIAVVLHWGMAIAIGGTFALGLWMVELDYYDPWYERGPDLHRSIGVLIALTLVLRLVLRLTSPVPTPLPSHSMLARVAHHVLYALVLIVAVAGYLMSTADGRGVAVFDWFTVPATLTSIEAQEDIAGDAHFYLACVLIGLAAVHAAGALKHHFLDRDETLRRMLGKKLEEES